MPQVRGTIEGRYRRALEVIFQHLKGHRFFAAGRVVSRWGLWAGAPGETAPPTVDGGVYCSLRLVGGPTTRAMGLRQGWVTTSKPSLLIELWVPGNDQLLFADVAEMLRLALTTPADPAEAEALTCAFREAGIADWQFTRDVLPAGPQDYMESMIKGSGTMELTLMFSSGGGR